MKNISEHLIKLYECDKTSQLIDELMILIKSNSSEQNNLLNLPDTPHTDWCKSLNMYCGYPNGIVIDENQSALTNFAMYIPELKKLGFNGLHILPFLKSPLIDRGFDISDFYTIQPDLGTFEELIHLKKVADEAGIHVFMDMLFNHVSDQHEWFKRAQSGDADYRNYFLHSKTKPKFIRKYTEDSAVWAEYMVDEKNVKLTIMFPNNYVEIPHWRFGEDGYWYYHSYYPQQLDLDWSNPAVFLEMAKIMVYWAKLGFNFRLDSILFVGKPAYKTDDIDNSKTHALMAALKCVVDAINPSLAFLAESFSDLNTIKKCLGTTECVQANLAYNFHLSTKLWLTIINHDTKYIWETLKDQQDIPEHATWLNFLRNHDELSLSHVDDETRINFYNKTIAYGSDFRHGCGISGRTFSLLANDMQRFKMAYFLLASCPGAMMLPYGDEIAYKNIPLNELSALEKNDSRNINRGMLLLTQKENTFQVPKDFFKLLFKKRLKIQAYLTSPLSEIELSPDIFSADYKSDLVFLRIYVNLTNQTKVISSALEEYKIINTVNDVDVELSNIRLGAYAGIWITSNVINKQIR